MKSRRVVATSDGLSSAGSLNGLATADSSGVAVLTTNYQWTRPRTQGPCPGTSDLSGRARPPSTAARRYLIDATTSNDAS